MEYNYAKSQVGLMEFIPTKLLLTLINEDDDERNFEGPKIQLNKAQSLRYRPVPP